jgi:hypothetical protein
MNVSNGFSLGLGFAIFDLNKEGGALLIFAFYNYFHHIHDFAMRGVTFNVDNLFFTHLSTPLLVTF